MDSCKYRYNQICTVFNKCSLPFVEYLQSGILTHINPILNNNTKTLNRKLRTGLSLLVESSKVESKDKEGEDSFEKTLTNRPNNYQLSSFQEEECSDYYTCCRMLPNAVAVGCRNSVIKIYK